MSEITAPRLSPWHDRYKRARTLIRKSAPFASGVAAALAAILIYNLLFPPFPPLTQSQVNETVALALASATPRPAYSAQVYEIIQPSLVLIEVSTQDADGKSTNGLGSGVIITDMGDILTSNHVVESADQIIVTFADGSSSNAQIVTAQPEIDIAVLRADQPPGLLIPAILGNPGAMRVGDEAFVIGNPFGLYSSMSVGVISGFNRSFQPEDQDQRLDGLIQVDAAINPGNSGGPLLNRSGQVVGIVVGIVNPTGQEVFIGIGFAVPIQVAASAVGGGEGNGGSLPY